MISFASICEPIHALQGGYFVINGSEKVLIAQEKMSNNQVMMPE